MAKKKPLASSRKQPLGVDAERTPRRARGRTGPDQTPVEIRSPGLELSDAVEPYVRAKLGAKLAAFALQIERVAVGFRDLNGPRGGEDIECRLRVVLVGRPDVVVHECAATVRRAFDRAHKRVGEAVKRDLERAGFSVGRRGGRGKTAQAEGEPSAAPEAAENSIPAASSRRSTTKSHAGARSGEKLAKRARERAHTPAAHAQASKVSRKGK